MPDFGENTKKTVKHFARRAYVEKPFGTPHGPLPSFWQSVSSNAAVDPLGTVVADDDG